MNILEDFWYGNINPQEQSKDNNRAIKELLNSGAVLQQRALFHLKMPSG